MAVKLESFLVLEESLASRLRNAWNRALAPVTKKIVKAVKKGDFYAAAELVNEIDLMPVAVRNEDYIRMIGMASILYGATKFSGADKTTFAGNPPPEILEKATRSIIQLIGVVGTETARRKAQEMLAAEEARQNEQKFKAEAVPFVTGFPRVVNSGGRQMVELGASLHTSRLASWGFTAEADALGKKFYKINEQLDGRTCPVCRVMNGKVFPVRPAREKLETQLSVQDPDELKTIATWPRQDAASVAALRTMTPAQLIARGWDTPPFHPLCRGVLVPTGQSVNVDQPADENRDAYAPDADITGTSPEAAALGIALPLTVGDDILPKAPPKDFEDSDL
jgi:hypothetical protein